MNLMKAVNLRQPLPPKDKCLTDLETRVEQAIYTAILLKNSRAKRAKPNNLKTGIL